MPADLAEFRATVRSWCEEHIPQGWREAQTGVSEEEFVRFQKGWFAELHVAGFAVPHWPREWGGGLRTRGAEGPMPVAEQIVLYQELAAHDAPRLVLAFVGIHHAASTLLAAGTDEQRRRHLPAILDGEIWVQGFSEPEAGSDLASLRTTARRDGDRYRRQRSEAVGQRRHACGLVPAAGSNRPGCPETQRYFVLPAGHDHTRRSRFGRSATPSATRTSARSSSTMSASRPTNLVGAENSGWQVAQATLGAERGMTMLELAERLGNAGFRWLVESCPTEDPIVADRLAQFETEITGLRGLCRQLVENNEAGSAGVADASIVKLYYSELLQRMTDFGAEIGGPAAHTDLVKSASSGWESGSWVLDFIGSWEWTIPGGSSEIQRTIIAERGLGTAARAERGLMAIEFAEFHAELRSVAGDLLAKDRTVDWKVLAEAGWTGLEVADDLGGAGATFAETAVICEEMGRAASSNSYLGSAVLAVGVLNALQPSNVRDRLLSDIGSGALRVAVALGSLDFVPDAVGADRLLVVTTDADGIPVVVDAAGPTVTPQPVARRDPPSGRGVRRAARGHGGAAIRGRR